MAQYREYERPTVSSGGCAYATLSCYNQGYYGKSVMAPTPATTPSMETLVVPNFGGKGYSSLMHGTCAPSCSGYFSIDGAYPNFPNNCSKFTSRLCG